jgi:hypothetical protein
MIPNIFVSSTISDLHYLRDGLRDAIEDLAYNPIMSEFGEVGYISQSTAAEACYRTVAQCQMLVLIIGKKYGTPAADGFSVTHREFLTAQEKAVPTITFVEAQVLNYKEVFDADPSAKTWTNFRHMDHPSKTFALIDSIKSSEVFNGLLPFRDVAEAKRMLKRQIADFVGERLSKTIAPLRDDMRDVLAELKTLKTYLIKRPSERVEASEKSSAYLRVFRFLFDDRQAEYRKLLEKIFGDIDVALPKIVEATDFDAVLKLAGWTYEILQSELLRLDEFKEKQEGHTLEYATTSLSGSYGVYSNKRAVFTPKMHERFMVSQTMLRAKLEF